MPDGELDPDVVEAVIEFGDDLEAERALEKYFSNSADHRDLWFATGSAMVRARVARRRHRPIEAVAHAREAIELAREFGHWLHLANAFEFANDIDAARDVLASVGATAELARFERRRSLTPADTAPDAALTHRELQVAALICEGLSSRQVADRLAIGRRTVDTHLIKIYAKLGFNTRIELATYMARVGDGTEKS
jgi:DNA-binding CsgD family transcriptional regulator